MLEEKIRSLSLFLYVSLMYLMVYALLISVFEGAESTLVMAYGMCASTIVMLAMVPKGGHIV